MAFEVLTMANCFSSLFTETTNKHLQQSIGSNKKKGQLGALNRRQYQTIRFCLR
jgi:hypothetical protein